MKIEDIMNDDPDTAGISADEAIARLHLAQEIQMDAINNIKDGFVLWDSDDTLITCNSKFKSMFFEVKNSLKPGLKYEDFVKATCSAGIFFPQVGQLDRQVQKRLKRHQSETAPYEERLCDGRWIQTHEHKASNQRIVGIFTDITEQKQSQTAVKLMVETDGLTGLYNRTMFNEYLIRTFERAKSSEQMFGVMVLDIDRFKSINDTMGHQMGDSLLREISNRLRQCVSATDTIARLGGDEFAVIVSDITEPSDMDFFAGQIVSTLAKPYFIHGTEVEITTSLGITVYPVHNDSTDDLIRNADIALYNAKEEGRNRFKRFDSEMDREAKKRRKIEIELQKAIAENQLELFYQPQIEISSGKIVGAEALVRWHHSEMGMISPGDFIPIAESTKLILPLGDWIIKAACKQTKSWQDRGLPPINVAVNISPVQFKQHDLPEFIAKVLEDTQLSPQWLEVEVTEGLAMEKNCQHQFEEIKKMGISIAIDDFGTGYSSLSQLTEFSIDRLKIDRSFVESIDQNPQRRTIFSAIVNMAKSLNFNVLAEGIETPEELAVIKSLGCHDAQGFLFAPALPAKTFEEFLLAHNAQPRPAEAVHIVEDKMAQSA